MQGRESKLSDRVDISEITFAQLEKIWQQDQFHLQQAGPFVSPPWLRSWWSCFGEKYGLLLLGMNHADGLVGVAPLMIDGNTARFIGSADLCDYHDILLMPEQGEACFASLFNHLQDRGINALILEPVRSDSLVINELVPYATATGHRVSVRDVNVSVSMDLPADWEEYLAGLSTKQRHETRRKFRRFQEKGEVRGRVIRDKADVTEAMTTFFQLFRQSREDKDSFLIPAREQFFLELALHLADANMLNLLEVQINKAVVAMVFCVDMGGTTYLYNNGFDPEYRSVSLGVVSKLMTIRQSIDNGMRHYDFLGGNEHYKSQLGGIVQTLVSCRVELNG